MTSFDLLDFSNATLKGTYAFTSIGRGGDAPYAAIGVIFFDGTGNIAGSCAANLPGRTFQERIQVKAPLPN